jgi:hypothetical protein
MELLRVQPYNNIDVEFEIPSDIESGTDFSITITDMADLSLFEELEYPNFTEDTISYSIYAKYDTDYRVVITADLETPTVVFDDIYSVRRPYVNPTTIGTTASEIASATANEELARAIIDSVIPQGFYYKKTVLETSGIGADYIPLWSDAKKLLKLYENNVLIYDAADPSSYTKNFEITKDKTAIVQSYTGILNRDQSAPLILPASPSDQLDMNFSYGGFPRGYDYRAILETGYVSVPSDIVRATKLLIEDVSCGKLDYYKRYISDYSTDQFKLKFSNEVFNGTGNLIVDKILSKYAKSITKLGVL